MPAPPVVATIGLHGSASTWVFNVVRELMVAAAGETDVLALVADTVAELPDPRTRNGRCLVIKSHHGSADLDKWLASSGALQILSIRDPRDACMSMSLRFKAPLQSSARWLAADCARMITLADSAPPILRYEDRFFDAPKTVSGLAIALGLEMSAFTTDAIFHRYRTEAVRSFAQRLAHLPPERVTQFGSSHLVDRVTQIHGVHIGDARSGKWRQLVEPVHAELTRRFAVFLERFGYEHS